MQSKFQILFSQPAVAVPRPVQPAEAGLACALRETVERGRGDGWRRSGESSKERRHDDCPLSISCAAGAAAVNPLLARGVVRPLWAAAEKGYSGTPRPCTVSWGGMVNICHVLQLLSDNDPIHL